MIQRSPGFADPDEVGGWVMSTLLRPLSDPEDFALPETVHPLPMPVRPQLLRLPLPLPPMPVEWPTPVGGGSRDVVAYSRGDRRSAKASDRRPYAWAGRLACMLTATATTSALLFAIL